MTQAKRPRPITDPDVIAAAVGWRMAVDAPDADAATHAACEAWRAAHPDHRQAFDEAVGVWAGLDRLDADFLARQAARRDPDDAALSAGSPPLLARRRVRPIATAAAALAACLSAAALLIVLWSGGRSPDYATHVAEIDDVALPDGSVITLGPKTSITPRYTDAARRVILDGGEAFFTVARDPARPFVVEHRGARITVLGTQFNVRTGPSGVAVSVTEGEVRVDLPAPPAAPAPRQPPPTRTVTLTAGQHVLAAPSAGLSDIETASASEPAPGSWRDGVLFIDEWTLRDVAAYAERYWDARIEFESDDVAMMTIDAIIKPDQFDVLMDGIAYTLPVTVERRSRRILIRQDS